MKKCFRVILAVAFLCFNTFMTANAQTTYDFSTNATLSYGSGGFGVWYTQANVTIHDVNYKLTAGGNGSFSNQATGGVSNSKVLRKDGSGGDVFTIERNDGQPFKFYGFWVKHQSMNNYAEFYSLPPFYTITYYKSDGTTETYNDNTAMQGGTSPGTYTTSSATFTKDLTVTSVSIIFKAMIYYWIDDINVGPVAVAPSFSAHPVSKNICAGSNTSYSVTASDATSYQWQVDHGSGFTNISASSIYSGATTSVLSISGALASMNGYAYRCVATGLGSLTSNSASLTVKSVSTTGVQSNIACFSGATGSATVTPSGGTAPYTFSWSPSGGTGATASGLTAGTYTVTVTDNNLCQATQSFTITQPAAALSAATAQNNISCFGGSNGVAAVSVSGGTAPYSYSWSPSGGTGAMATGLAAGTYTVTITDANSCQTTKSVSITQPSAVLSATTSQSAVSCFGGANGTGTVTVSGGTAPYTYSWSPSGGTNASASGLAAGTYTVTITDANSCQTTKSVSITQPSATLSATTTKSDVSCRGGTNGVAGVTVSGGTAPYTYSWSPSGGTNATATGLAAGTYTVTITDDKGCQTIKSISITQPSATLSATTTQSDVTCKGGTNGSAGVTVSGGTAPYTYSWSPSGGTGATASGLGTGSYTVTITDDNGCQTTKSFTITEPAIITASTAPASTIVCSGSATDIQLSSNTSGATFNWTVSTVSGTVSGASASGGSSIAQVLSGNGEVKYTITPSKGSCTGTTTSVNITVKPLTTITEHPIDKNIDEEQNAIFSITAAHATGYQWQVDKGSGYVNIVNGAPYAGATTAVLTVANATGDMNGYEYRCVGTGTCSPAVSSNSATLSVRVKTSQTVTINGTASATYGDADFAPVASSGSGLEISFSSSNNDIAQIVNGKVHILKVGEVTITASQAGDNDYKPAAPVTQLLTIAKKDITIAFQSNPAISKEYDGNKTATLVTQNLTVEGLVNNDEVGGTFTAEYADKKAGEGKTISIRDISLSGSDKENYKLLTTTASVTGTIEQKGVIPSIVSSPVISKEYDATKNVTLAANLFVLTGILAPDAVSVGGNALYADKNAGSNKIITVSELVLNGDDKDNYKLTTETIQTTGEILPKEAIARITSVPAITNVYDGNVNAGIPNDRFQLLQVFEGDDISATGTAVFDDKNAGNGKVITVDNMVLTGPDRNNYVLSNTLAIISGSITPKPLTISLQNAGLVSKNTTVNKATYLLNGIVGNDDVKLTAPVSTTSMNKAGAPRGAAVNDFTLIGRDAGNYTLDVKGVIEPPAARLTEKLVKFRQTSGSKLATEKSEEITMNAWSVSPHTIYVKVTSAKAQKASLVVYTEAGSPVLLQQKQLNAGVNVFTVPATSLARGIYLVGLKGTTFKSTRKVRL